MASITKRPDGRWRARYRDASNQEHAKHFDRKVDGQRWLDEVTAAVVTGQYVDPRAGRVTLEAYGAQWVARQPWRPKTRQRVESNLRVHLNPVLGSRPLSTIVPGDVQALVLNLREKLAPGTVRVVYATLRSLFLAAVLDRHVAVSPCRRVKLPTPTKKHLDVPDAVAVHTLAGSLPPYWSAVPVVAAGLGLRPGELFGLKVEDVDFLRRSVTVRQQLGEDGLLGPLKTPASYRTVPLPTVVADTLARHLADADRHEGLVFLNHDGQSVKRKTFVVAWRRALVRAGREGLRLHDLRHSYASALIEAGESVKVVQTRMGHASAMITLDVYGHLWPDSEDRTRSAVDAWLAPPADSLRTVRA